MRRSTRLAQSGDGGSSSSKAKLNGHHHVPNEDKEIYKIDDFVFYETSPSEPYGIGKITDLFKNANNYPVAKLTTFVRRNSTSRHVKDAADTQDRENAKDFGLEYEVDTMPDDVRIRVLQRELFLTKETVEQPISTFRGKCVVLGLCEVDSRKDFSSRNDYFYYVLQYDRSLSPPLKFPDRGEIRVGSKYQAEIPALLTDKSQYSRKCENLETLVYQPNKVSEAEFEDYLETFTGVASSARFSSGLSKYSESIKCAYLAKRDTTLQRAHDHLHKYDYDFQRATAALSAEPQLAWITDPLESWSDLERASFYNLLKVQKDFFKIQDYMPFCDTTTLVEFYYLWKSTEQAQTHRIERSASGQRKLKHVSFNSQAKIFSNSVNSQYSIRCDHCKSQMNVVFEITPKKLCSFCFSYWKKYYSFPHQSQLANRNSSSNKAQASSKTNSTKDISKGSPPFDYRAVNDMKEARFIVGDILKLKRIAKNPFKSIDVRMFSSKLNERKEQGIKAPSNPVYINKKIEDNPKLVVSPLENCPLNFDKKDSSGSRLSKRRNDASAAESTNGIHAILKRRRMVTPSILAKSISDHELYFASTEHHRQLRKKLTPKQLRHYARNPHSPISSTAEPTETAAVAKPSLANFALPTEASTPAPTKRSSKASSAASAVSSLPLNHPAFTSNSSSNSLSGNAALLAAFGAANPLANFPGLSHLSSPTQLAALQQILQQQFLQNSPLTNNFPNNFMNFAQNSNGRAFNGASSSGKHSK